MNAGATVTTAPAAVATGASASKDFGIASAFVGGAGAPWSSGTVVVQAQHQNTRLQEEVAKLTAGTSTGSPIIQGTATAASTLANQAACNAKQAAQLGPAGYCSCFRCGAAGHFAFQCHTFSSDADSKAITAAQAARVLNGQNPGGGLTQVLPDILLATSATFRRMETAQETLLARVDGVSQPVETQTNLLQDIRAATCGHRQGSAPRSPSASSHAHAPTDHLSRDVHRSLSPSGVSTSQERVVMAKVRFEAAEAAAEPESSAKREAEENTRTGGKDASNRRSSLPIRSLSPPSPIMRGSMRFGAQIAHLGHLTSREKPNYPWKRALRERRRPHTARPSRAGGDHSRTARKLRRIQCIQHEHKMETNHRRHFPQPRSAYLRRMLEASGEVQMASTTAAGSGRGVDPHLLQAAKTTEEGGRLLFIKYLQSSVAGSSG